MEATAGAWAAEWVRLCTALLSPARAAGLRGRAAPLRCRFFETLRTDRKGGFVILGVIRGYGPIWAVCGLPTGPRAEFWPTRGPTTAGAYPYKSVEALYIPAWGCRGRRSRI